MAWSRGFGGGLMYAQENRKRLVEQERVERQAKDAQSHAAVNFVRTIQANMDNDKLTDTEFRDFIRRSITVVPNL